MDKLNTKMGEEQLKMTETTTAVPGGPQLTFNTMKNIQEDLLMETGISIACDIEDPKEAKEFEERINNKLVSEDMKYFDEIVEKFNIFVKGKTYRDCWNVADYVISNYYSNAKENEYVLGNEKYDSITKCYRAGLIAWWKGMKNVKISGSPLILQILDYLKDKEDSLLKNDGSMPLKFKIYSGHDSIMLPILAILGAWDESCILNDFEYGIVDKDKRTCCHFPNFGSILNFEFYFDKNTK